MSSVSSQFKTDSDSRRRLESSTERTANDTIQQRFEHQATLRPEAIAASCDGSSRTYQELNARANQLAHFLRSQGVKPDMLIGVCTERSFDLLVALLGILKAGAAYLPIDLAYPADRLAFMLADAQAPFLLTQTDLLANLPQHAAQVLCLDDSSLPVWSGPTTNPEPASHSDHLAYVIYTSGSTGQPKGVEITHHNVTRLFDSTQRWFHFDERDVWMLFHSYAFDFSVWEIWGALLYGGRVVVVPFAVSRSPHDFYQLLAREKVTVLNQTPSAFRQLSAAEEAAPTALSLSLRLVIFGGEALEMQSLKPWFDRHGDAQPQLVNMYGITETTVHVTYRPLTKDDLSKGSVIGVPIPDLQLHILDEALQPCGEGETGELFVGGAGLARGYLKRPELTAQRFITDPANAARLYRTGDLGRRLENGDIEYLGRMDQQVQLRGFRVELGEIESVLMTHPSVRDAKVLLREDQPGLQRLVAYLITREAAAGLRDHLRQKLPEYMIPAAFVTLETFPLTVNGKLDVKALPAPPRERSLDGISYTAARTDLEKALVQLWEDALQLYPIGTQESFFDLGGQSLLLVKMHTALVRRIGIELPITEAFQYPTIEALARRIESLQTAAIASSSTAPPSHRSAEVALDGIAIVGMTARVPGAETLDEFWKILIEKRETISTFAPDELAAEEPKNDPDYVPRRGILNRPEWFDAGFFGMKSKESEATDPQQRLFLESAWHALEDAGLDPATFAGAIGVFAGMGNNSFYAHQVEFNEELRAQVGPEGVMIGNEKDYLATRIAHKLNLRGPALNIYTACSTSLVAICQAVASLQNHQCDAALAGGVSVKFPQTRGHLYQEGSLYSADGHVWAFDERAQGTIFSSGLGIVVLRRLEDAVRDGDRIYAVIKGAALNNDGAAKMSFTAPSVQGHAEVISLALAHAHVKPETISYIEAHGTGTPLGDPIEIAGLTQAFRQGGAVQTQTCPIGSVKTNLGHLDTAGGVVGVIKTALMMHHRIIAPSINYERPNPAVGMAKTPFFVNTEARPWLTQGFPLRAGVSSFGLGGTNAHCVLEEAPAATKAAPDQLAEQVLLLSAKSEAALEELTRSLAAHLEIHPGANLADIAWTLQTGRSSFAHRRIVVAADAADAAKKLRALDAKEVFGQRTDRSSVPVAFVFPGQGSQHAQMGRRLYEQEPIFAEAVDACRAILQPLLGLDILALISSENAAHELAQTQFTQPALFVTEYALAKLLMSWGIQPERMIGHSIGEYVAAHLAGVMSLESALRLVAARGRLMSECAPGTMLALRLNEAEVRALLPEGLDIAALNGVSMTVVSGPESAIAAFEETLNARQITGQRLKTSHAFHSAMMEPALEKFRAVLAEVKLDAPLIPYVSNLSGRFITDAEATSTDYYVRHIRETVRFADGVKTICEASPCVILEVGPGQALAPLCKQHPATASAAGVLSCLPPAKEEGRGEVHVLHQALGRLWLAGTSVDWAAIHGAPRRKVSLPLYPFQRQRYYPDFVLPGAVPKPQPQQQSQPKTEALPVEAAATSSRKERLVAELRKQLQKISGMDLTTVSDKAAFLDLGFDSLFLTQASLFLKKHFGPKITFRQMAEELSCLDALGTYLDEQLPPEAYALIAAPALAKTEAALSSTPTGVSESLANIEREIAKLRSSLQQGSEAPRQGWQVRVEKQAAGSHKNIAFGPFRPLQTAKDGSLTAQQKAFLDKLMADYNAKTPSSKAFTQKHRAHLADPRAVSGFNHLWKEAVYPIVTNRSKGSKVWDIDGNEFVDITLGFGPLFLGHSPDFVLEAVHRQLDEGFEIGPTSPLAGEVAEMLLEFTGMERVAFCNTGSEAVMAAIRMARTVTGRDKVVTFAGDYHGTFDEVLIRPLIVDGVLKTAPIAPGIPESVGDNILVLDYNNPESLEIIRAHAHDLAAVLVEPVRSRDPGLQPEAFLKALREITTESGTALIFDEVVTGFRSHYQGAQGYFGITADIATYGKVVGGGLPIGIVAGRRQFMDALDGGMWSYGDDSGPEVGVTFFAGTFVRHPLALAAAKAVLTFLKQQGPALQESLNAKTASLVQAMNAEAERLGVPMRLHSFSSYFYPTFSPAIKYTEPFFQLMRLKGIYVWSARPWFLSIAHTDEDIAKVLKAFSESLLALQEGGFFPLKADGAGHAAIVATEDAPLTPAQQELFLASHLDEEAALGCHENLSLKIKGPLVAEQVREALNLLAQRHDSLRAYVTEDGEAMRFSDAVQIPLTLADLSTTPEPQHHAQIEALIEEAFTQKLPLHQAPLMRATLVKTGPDRHQLIIVAHHIVADGWSFGVIANEFPWAYHKASGRRVEALPDAAQMASYAREFVRQRAAGEFSTDKAYWLSRYATMPETLVLPADKPRPAVASYVTSAAQIRVSPELTERLKRFCKERRLTAYQVMLSVWQLLMHRLSGASDFIVGVPLAGQAAVDAQDLCGHCVQFLPLRCSFADTDSGLDLLDRVRREMMDATEHQNFTLGELLEHLPSLSGQDRRTFATTVFSLEPLPSHVTNGDLEIAPVMGYKRRAAFELTLYAYQGADDFTLNCSYRREIYDEGTIQRWLGHYLTLLDHLLEQPETPVRKLRLLTATERSEMLTGFNADTATFPNLQCLHHGFEETAAKSPEAPALTCGGVMLTYAQLNSQANQIAHRLIAEGVKPESLVALCMDRDALLIVSLLGILKAGAAYVPLDLSYPAERLAHIIEDSGASILLTQTKLLAQLPAHLGRTLCVDDASEGIADQPTANPATSVGLDHVAYVIYTSGSTGKPKGCMVTHRNVARLMKGTEAWYGFGREDVWTLFHSAAFDFSVWEIWGALLYGGRLVVVPFLISRSPVEFYELLSQEKVTVLNQTPSAFRQLMVVEESLSLPLSLRYVIFGGEALEMASLKPWFAHHGDAQPQLINMYGITETTVHVTYRPLTQSDTKAGSVIGVPIPDLQLYVLNEHLEPQPLGVPGEMYVGGEGLARGYLNRPELTAARFIPDPFSSHADARLYRTGDLARMLAGRDLEYLGRADEQVKIRGFRIELGEIESVLRTHSSVKDVAVIAHADAAGDKQLTAYLVTAGVAPSSSELRHHLQVHLPDYMVPASFVPLDKLPLTTNGKLDRKALPKPESCSALARENEHDFIPPQTPTQTRLAGLWQEVLGRNHIGAHSDFFAVGGTSLNGLRLFTRIQKEFQLTLPLGTLFQATTIEKLARVIDLNSMSRAHKVSPLVCIQPVGQKPLLCFIHGGDGGAIFYKDLLPNLNAAHPVYTIEAPALVDALMPIEPTPPEKVAADYIALLQKTQPRGPYVLGGYSYGGVVAYEMACQLTEAGHEVALVILFDSENPNTQPRAYSLRERIVANWKSHRERSIFQRLKLLVKRFSSGVQERLAYEKETAFAKQLLRDGVQTTDEHIRQVQLREASTDALLAYRARPYSGTVLLFHSDSASDKFAYTDDYNWSELVPNLIIDRVPGPHLEIFDEANVGIMAEKLSHRLKELLPQSSLVG